MIKITNGKDVVEVTRGAYESVYMDQGFRPVETTKASLEKIAEEAEGAFDKFVEKPISAWHKAEVEKFAEAKGIDLSGANGVKEQKAIVKEYMDGQDADSVEDNTNDVIEDADMTESEDIPADDDDAWAGVDEG